jgi:hypothetical protein
VFAKRRGVSKRKEVLRVRKMKETVYLEPGYM